VRRFIVRVTQYYVIDVDDYEGRDYKDILTEVYSRALNGEGIELRLVIDTYDEKNRDEPYGKFVITVMDEDAERYFK